MKYPIKRFFAVLLVFVLAASSLAGISAHAQEQPTAYVLHYDGQDAKPYLYGSRFEYKHSYNGPAMGETSTWTYWNCPEIFNLVSTADGSSIAAYCTDADTSTKSNTSYRRINLEDSTYHATGAAEKLRSILLSSFPCKSVEEVAASANAAGFTVTQLQQGELISATQQAIWETTHTDKYTVDIHSTGLRSMDDYDENDFVYPESLSGEVTDHTATNMENLYRYFLSLEGTGPLTDAVSEYTFENVTYAAQQQADGTYQITVSYTIATAINEGDDLTLTATCADQVQTMPLSAGDGSVTFTGLDHTPEVKLSIDGWEKGYDVYLFDAEGDRTASQSMVGFDSSLLPVHAEVTAPPRNLNITKTTGQDEGKTPLANIQFDIYLAATMAQLESGEVVLSQIPTPAEIEAAKKNFVTTLTTDANGFASFNLSAAGWPDGVYMIAERFNPATTGAVDPFFVAIPGTDKDGQTRLYTVSVNPKNDTESGPIIKKDVTQIENDLDSFDINQIHTWIIRGGVPAGIREATQYAITDTLDYRLTLQSSIAVRVGLETDEAGTEALTLIPDADYKLTVSTTQDSEGRTVDTFQVALTQNGMKKAADAVSSGTKNHLDYEIRVYFDAVINTNAQMGTLIPNTADLDYTNSAGIHYDAVSDRPEVYTGGIRLLKIDAASATPLADAHFQIAKAATDAEIADGVSQKLTVQGKLLDVVFIPFHNTPDLSGEKVLQTVSGTDGNVYIYGLAQGTYYIVETKAPSNYNLLTAPITVQIDRSSHLTAADNVTDSDGKIIDHTVTVRNAKFLLPETGGMGTVLFTVLGIAILASSVMMVLLTRKKQD